MLPIIDTYWVSSPPIFHLVLRLPINTRIFVFSAQIDFSRAVSRNKPIWNDNS